MSEDIKKCLMCERIIGEDEDHLCVVLCLVGRKLSKSFPWSYFHVECVQKNPSTFGKKVVSFYAIEKL